MIHSFTILLHENNNMGTAVRIPMAFLNLYQNICAESG